MGHFKPKKTVLESSTGVLSKGHRREWLWKAGRLLIMRPVGESYQELIFAGDFEAVI